MDQPQHNIYAVRCHIRQSRIQWTSIALAQMELLLLVFRNRYASGTGPPDGGTEVALANDAWSIRMNRAILNVRVITHEHLESDQ